MAASGVGSREVRARLSGRGLPNLARPPWGGTAFQIPSPSPPAWGAGALPGGGGKMAWEAKRPAVGGADAPSRGWRGDSVGG